MIHKITNPLYVIKLYKGERFYVECSTLDELYHHIAKHYVLNGYHITSVCRINSNGSTSKIAVLNKKEFKTILAQYKNFDYAIKLFEQPNSAVDRLVDFDVNSAQISWHNKAGTVFTSIIEPSKNAKKGYVVIDGKEVIVDDWMKEKWCD